MQCKIHKEAGMVRTPVPCPDGRQGCAMVHYEWLCTICEAEKPTMEERIIAIEKRLNNVETKILELLS